MMIINKKNLRGQFHIYSVWTNEIGKDKISLNLCTLNKYMKVKICHLLNY